MNIASEDDVWLSSTMPTASTATPATITVREPSRSSRRPASGEPTDIATTTGIRR